MLPPFFTSGKDPVSIVQYSRLGGPQGRSGQLRKISPPTWIRSPDRPARSQSLYRLSYRAYLYMKTLVFFFFFFFFSIISFFFFIFVFCTGIPGAPRPC
jgi:hypothetical protein